MFIFPQILAIPFPVRLGVLCPQREVKEVLSRLQTKPNPGEEVALLRRAAALGTAQQPPAAEKKKRTHSGVAFTSSVNTSMFRGKRYSPQ